MGFDIHGVPLVVDSEAKRSLNVPVVAGGFVFHAAPKRIAEASLPFISFETASSPGTTALSATSKF